MELVYRPLRAHDVVEAAALPRDARGSQGRRQIQNFSGDLHHHYISHRLIAVSGFIAATGIAVVVLTWFGVRRGLLWAWVDEGAPGREALTVAVFTGGGANGR
jgi:hypothetical protein